MCFGTKRSDCPDVLSACYYVRSRPVIGGRSRTLRSDPECCVHRDEAGVGLIEYPSQQRNQDPAKRLSLGETARLSTGDLDP